MENSHHIGFAFRMAFPYTVPIMTGFVFLGISYGFYMHSLGFSAIYPMLMSLTIFAGSMEFVTANLLLGAFNPLNALILTLMVNGRHLFYGISMLDQYHFFGKKKWYMIFGLCDESFSINSTVDVPKNVNKGWFMFFVTLLNHAYWVIGATLGGVFGALLKFNTKGLDFVMTALFVVIFIERWTKETTHHSALMGLGLSAVSLMIFGGNQFILPSMLAILGLLTMLRKPLEKLEVIEE